MITHPELAKEYSPRNPLPANRMIAGTSKKLWWKCSKPECGHEWRAAGQNRIREQGCPGCSGRVATPKNNLAETHPALAKEYSSRNLLPATQVIARTNKKLWWKCSKPECGNEWKTAGYNRVHDRSCPKCARKKGWETRRKNKKK